MRLFLSMAPSLFRDSKGGRVGRVEALGELGIRLSLLGYAASAVMPFIDKPVPADLAAWHVVAITAVLGTIASTFVKPV